MLGRLAVVALVAFVTACGAGEDDAARSGGCTANLGQEIGGEVEVHAPSWSPDGRRIAFTAIVEDGGEGGVYALSVADCAVERLGPERSDVFVGSLDWSPRGPLAFEGTDPGTGAGGIYTMRPDGSGVRRLTEGSDLFPEWSPDGELIAFVREIVDEVNAPLKEDRNVWVVGADGTGLRRVTKGPWHGSAGWSPDGARLVTDENGAVVEVGLDGGNRRVLVRGEHSYPSWSPDGTRLVLGGLALAPGEGGAPEPLDTPDALEPEWSPDGRRIAFVDGENAADLWVVGADGSGLRQLTRSR